MNHRNMERSNNVNWILCPSKSFPGKFYYFNVLTGEAAWTLSEMENARAMQKNSYITKVNRWHTYPEPNSPPDDRYLPEPSWQRKHGQHPFSRPIMPIFGEQTFPVYRSQYTTPQLPNMMHNPTQISPIIMGDMKKHPDLQNMWGYDRDPYSTNMDTMKRFVRWEKPPVFNINHASSAPIDSQWGYDYQNIGATPIVGQNLPNAAPRMYEPRTNVNKEFTQWRTHSESCVIENENSLFGTKLSNNLRSLDESASFDQTRSSQKNAQFTPKSPIFQGTRIFGTRPYEDVQTHGDSDCFEMPKPKIAVHKSILSAQPVRNVRLSKPILNKSDSSLGNLMAGLSLTPRKRPQSVPSDQEKERMMNGGQDWKSGQRELSEDDLRYKLAKKKKYDNTQDRTVTKIKTSYSNTNVTTPVTKRVTFAMDFQSNGNEGTEFEQNDDLIYDNEPARKAAPVVSVKALKGLAKPQTKTEPWYIVVDAEVLLEDFESIATFVRADTKCRLLIPSVVGNQINAITAGECRGRQRVVAARQLARVIASPPDYMTVQTGEEHASSTSVSELIVNCCLEAVDQNCHVVLVTNDANLHKKAESVDIPCVTLREIKDSGASTPKPAVSFDTRKIIINPDMNNANGKNNQRVTVTASSTINPFNMSSRSEIPVHCFRNRLLDAQDMENNVDENDKNEVTNLNDGDAHDIPKTSADRENFQKSDIFASKSYRGIKKPVTAEGIPEDESRAERTVKMNKLKSINKYNIEEHLREYVVKTKLVEDRLKTRMEEWICSFSQIMEDILTYILILQECPRTQGALTPPWTLAEAVECVRQMYGDHSSIKIIVERLSALLFACSSRKGQLKLEMEPNDFMTVLGLAILLIQCLQNVVPAQCELCEAEEALLSLLQLVTDPGVEPTLWKLLREPSVCTSNEPSDCNCAKKQSEVIEYLRTHYPEWKAYETDQAKEKGKQPQKIVRTFVNNQHNFKTDKTISLNQCEASTEKDYDAHFNSNDSQKAKKIQLGDKSDKAIKMTGAATLLRNMAINSSNKVPTLQNIDVEKRDKDGEELLGMINTMIGNAVEDATDSNIADVNDGNNSTNQVCDENQASSDKEPRFVIKFGNFTIRKVNMKYNNFKNKITSINDTPEENTNDTKHENPKDKKDNFNKNLDLDALDYEIDKSEDENSDANVTCKDIEIYNPNIQADKESPQNYNGNNDKQDNEMNDPNQHADDESPQKINRNGDVQDDVNIDTDTTKDSGYENDSLHDYFLTITCLTKTKLREIIMYVYNFLSRTSKKMRDEHIAGDAKVALHQKTSKGCKALAKIIRGLQSIIAKESDDRTCMRTALVESGVDAVDSRLIKYKQEITKYLNQMLILEEAMQVLVTAIGPAPPSVDGHGTD